jgi:glycosyltransferase involved in cell wall biosynthesis
VLDAHNALWLLYKRLWETMPRGLRRVLLGRDWRLLKTYEGRLVREFDAVMAVSEEDKEALLVAAGQPREINVIPIAIDTHEVTMVRRVPEPNHILHIGTMFWPPNADGVLWFLREVWPLVRESRPDVIFDVVGSRPSPEIVAYGENGSGVNVTGYVANVGPHLAQAGVFVVPLRAGGGMRVKILNALAQGLPIVSTTLGAEGIAVMPGRDIMLADEPPDFAAAVLHLLDDSALADYLRRNGRELAERAYDYRRACHPLADLFGQTIADASFGTSGTCQA